MVLRATLPCVFELWHVLERCHSAERWPSCIFFLGCHLSAPFPLQCV